MQFTPLTLQNKKILVTGASSGIGKATAIYLSKLGAKIVLTGRNKERLEETKRLLEGNQHSLVQFDLTDLDNIEKIFEMALEDNIKLNGFVHCAGIPYVMPLRVLTPSAMIDCFKNDFFCFVELVRQYSRAKYSEGGSIVAISSVSTERLIGGEIAYCTAKAALNNAIMSMATELSKKHIRINGVLVGNILTEMLEKTFAKYDNREMKDNEVKQSLIGRWGVPEDVAATCAFLLSEMSSFTTASLVDCAGGIK